MEIDYKEKLHINQMDIKEIVPHTLEFICQSPNTAASYENTKHTSKSFIDGFNYYQEGDLVRSINGKYDESLLLTQINCFEDSTRTSRTISTTVWQSEPYILNIVFSYSF